MVTIQDAFIKVEEDRQKAIQKAERLKQVLEYLWDHYLYYLQDAETFPELDGMCAGAQYESLTFQFNISDKKEMGPVLQYMKTLPIFKIQKPKASPISYDVTYWIDYKDLELIHKTLGLDYYWEHLWISIEFYPKGEAACILKKVGTKRVSYEQSIYSFECIRE